MHGGKREGSGRKVGSKSKLSKEIADRVLSEGISPLEVLVDIMRKAREEGDTITAIDAAKAAAPYMHPRLNAIDMGNKDDAPFTINVVKRG